MTPVATANVHEVVSSSLCVWITESLEQFGVDSRVFLRVIQSVLEQDIQSLRGEERLNDLWSYRLESIGSKRKPMSKEDLLRRVLLENMRPCFKEDESCIAEEFVDELLFRWNEEVKIKAEACRIKREERNWYSSDETDEEKTEDTRDPVTQYHEAFPALVAPRVTNSSEVDPVATQDTRSSAIRLEWWKSESDKLPNYQVKGTRGYRNAPARFMDRCLGSGKTLGRHSQHRWTDHRAGGFGVALGVIQNDSSRQFSVGNYELQNASYQQGSVFDRFVAQIIKSNAPEKLGSSYTASRGPRHGKYRAQVPFAPMPAGFLHRTIEKILSQNVAGDSNFESARVVGNATYRRVPGGSGKDTLPIYMENEFGVLVCVSDNYGLRGARNIESSDDGTRITFSHLGLKSGNSAKHNGNVGLAQSHQRSSVVPALRVSRDVALPGVCGQPYAQPQPGSARTRYLNPNYWVMVDPGFDEDGIERCLNAQRGRCDASWSSLLSVDANAEPDDTLTSYGHESDAPPDYSCYSSVLGNFFRGSAPDSRRKYPDCFLNSPAELTNVSLHDTGEKLGQIEDFIFMDSSFADRPCADFSSCETLATSEVKPSRMSFDKLIWNDLSVGGNFDLQDLHSCRTALSVYRTDEGALTSRSLGSIANLVAEISERDLMNDLATSLSFLFPDVLLPRSLYLPKSEMLAFRTRVNFEPRYDEAETYPYDYRLYLCSALGRGDLDVDQILNCGDFRRWRSCVLNQATGSGKIACVCDLCCRGQGSLVDTSFASAKSANALGRSSPNHSAGFDYDPGSCALVKTAFPLDFADSDDKSIDIYEFILGNSVREDAATGCRGFACSGEDAPVPVCDGDADESFAADWNKIRAIWSDKDRASSYAVHGASVFLEELYEENNNKVTESFNLFPCGSQWLGGKVDRKPGRTGSNLEPVVAHAAVSVDFGYNCFSRANERLENEAIFSRDGSRLELESRSSSSSSVTFSRMLSSEEETCDGCRVTLDEDLYSRWLNASLCRSCRACVGAGDESPASSGLMSSECCGSLSLDAADALQCVSFLWSIDDAGALSEEDLEREETGSYGELLDPVRATRVGPKARDGAVQFASQEKDVISVDSDPCCEGNSQHNVPYKCDGSECIETASSLGSDKAMSSSLSFLSARYSDDSKLCGMDFSPSEAMTSDSADMSTEENLLAEGFRSDSETGHQKSEMSRSCPSTRAENQPVRSANIGTDRTDHRSSFETHDVVPTKDGNSVLLSSSAGCGFENFDHLKILWEEQRSEGARLTASGEGGSEDGILGYDANSPGLEGWNDPANESMTPEPEAPAELINICGQTFENINFKGLVSNEGLLDKPVMSGSLEEEAGLEKIKRVKALWDSNKTDVVNAKRKRSDFEEERVDDADELDDVRIIWRRPSLDSEDLEDATSVWHLDRDVRTSVFGLESCFGQALESVSCDVREELLQDSRYLSLLLSESREDRGLADEAHPHCPSAAASGPSRIGSDPEQPATKLEAFLRRREHNDFVASYANDTVSLNQMSVLENQMRRHSAPKDVACRKSEWNVEQEIHLQNFHGLASIWESDEPRRVDVGTVGPDSITGLACTAAVSGVTVGAEETGLGSEFLNSILYSCPDRAPSSENLASSEFCYDAEDDDDDIQQFKALKSIWEDPQLTLDSAPRSSSFETSLAIGIPRINEETVGCDITSDDIENFKHLKCIWEAPLTAAECIQIPVSFQNQQAEAAGDVSIEETQPDFDLVIDSKTFAAEAVDFEGQDDSENNEELTLIWEKKKTRLENFKMNIISSKENGKPLVSTKLISIQDEDEDEKDNKWDSEKIEAGNLGDFKILGHDDVPSSNCRKTLDCEGLGGEMCAKNIEQLKSIWDESVLDVENGNGSLACWGDPAPATQNLAEELPEWDLGRIESKKFTEKRSVWCESKLNLEGSGDLPLFWDGLELAVENLTEAASEPVALASYNDQENFKDLMCHRNDSKADVENANGSMTGWRKPKSDAETFMKLPREVSSSDFDSNLLAREEMLKEKFSLNEQRNVQNSTLSSQFDNPTMSVDNWDTVKCCHERSLDSDKLNKLRSLWENKNLPTAEGLRRVASLSCWEQDGRVSQSLRRISSESLWEPLDPTSENLSHTDSELRWELKASSSDSLKQIGGEDFSWENDSLTTDTLKQRTLVSSCQDAENLPDVIRGWHTTQAVPDNLESTRGDHAFNEDFKELQSIWQKDLSTGENLDQLPWAFHSQDQATEWSGSQSDSQYLQLEFDLICQQQPDAKITALKKSNVETTDNFDRESSDRASCDPSHVQATGDYAKIWLCPRTNDFQNFSADVGDWGSGSDDDLKRLISQLGEHDFESRGFFKGLLTDVELRDDNLANEWELAEAFSLLRSDDDVVATDRDLWQLIRQNRSDTPKLVPSENTAFRDNIPHRFAYRYSFFDPQDARCYKSMNARTETIKHIYDPSHSIMRQLEDVFDDGQRLHSEEALRVLPHHVFRPIGGHSPSGRDSYHSNRTSVCGGDVGDLVLRVKTTTPDSAEVLGPDSPYQLYFGAESKTFVPRFRVHKEQEKSAQTGEATPPMQDIGSICNMNVILSTMALLD